MTESAKLLKKWKSAEDAEDFFTRKLARRMDLLLSSVAAEINNHKKDTCGDLEQIKATQLAHLDMLKSLQNDMDLLRSQVRSLYHALVENEPPKKKLKTKQKPALSDEDSSDAADESHHSVEASPQSVEPRDLPRPKLDSGLPQAIALKMKQDTTTVSNLILEWFTGVYGTSVDSRNKLYGPSWRSGSIRNFYRRRVSLIEMLIKLSKEPIFEKYDLSQIGNLLDHYRVENKLTLVRLSDLCEKDLKPVVKAILGLAKSHPQLLQKSAFKNLEKESPGSVPQEYLK